MPACQGYSGPSFHSSQKSSKGYEFLLLKHHDFSGSEVPSQRKEYEPVSFIWPGQTDQSQCFYHLLKDITEIFLEVQQAEDGLEITTLSIIKKNTINNRKTPRLLLLCYPDLFF